MNSPRKPYTYIWYSTTTTTTTIDTTTTTSIPTTIQTYNLYYTNTSTITTTNTIKHLHIKIFVNKSNNNSFAHYHYHNFNDTSKNTHSFMSFCRQLSLLLLTPHCSAKSMKKFRFGSKWFDWKVFCIADIVACRPCRQSRSCLASRQRSKRNSYTTFRTGHVTASSLQYLSAALFSHVYLCHFRHVVLHARQEKEWHRRRLQFRNLRPEYDFTVSSKQSNKEI